ncbi:MAG: hypothetical protein HUU06_07090 [Planctomycetaceae bacterium]|nr:hypothetical protein [Planctomycetaceae bacterium]
MAGRAPPARIGGMFNPKTDLVSHFLAARAAELAADAAHPGAWEGAKQALDALHGTDPDLAAAVEARDLPALRGILDQWTSGKRPPHEHDRDLLKRAMRAFRKRLGVTVLDAESTVGGGPMSGGRSSDIAGITPPRDYPREIWLELARQGRLRNAGQGVFELGRGG